MDFTDIMDIMGVMDITDVTDITDITDITDVVDITDIADVTDVTDITGFMNVTEITGGTVRHMATHTSCLLVYSVNRIGPKHEPCGTPQRRCDSEERTALSNITHCLQAER